MSAHKAPTPAHTFVIHEGRRFPILNQPGRGWRLRSRSKHAKIDVLLGLGSEAWARKRAGEVLRGDHVLAARPKKSGATVADLLAIYEKMSKRASKSSAVTSSSRLRMALRVVYDAPPEKVKVEEINPRFWLTFSAKKQGLENADLSTRRLENIAINAAMRQAAAVLAPKLRPAYEEAGITIRADATVIQWLPEVAKEPDEIDDKAMFRAWFRLQKTDLQLWLCIGLARFVGLRRAEIEHARDTWLEGMNIRLKDRPGEGWLNKTGRSYTATIIHRRFARILHALPPGYLVNPPDADRGRWFEREPQRWLKQFTGAQKPLHRLRGLYADHVAKVTADAVTAKLAGVKAASGALGHTSTKTTKDHYLSEK